MSGVRTAVLPLVFLGLACADGGPEDDPGSLARVDTLADGRVAVVNSAAAWTPAEAWTAEEDLRIGTLDGTGPDQFGQISSIKVDAEGRIHVLDYITQDVRVFDSSGVYQHTIGSRGEGPGELMSAAGLNWSADGDLWVWDTGGRFSIFSPEGDYLESRTRSVRGVIYPWRGQFDVDGSLIDWGLDYPDLSTAPGAPAPTRIIYYPVRFSGDFASGDTLPPLEFQFDLAPDGESMIFGERMSTFQDREGTIWFARNKSFTLFRRTLEGDTVLQTSVPAQPAAVTAREIDSVQAHFVAQGFPGGAPGPERFADTRAMIRRIFSDDRGHIFVLSEQADLPLGTFVDVLDTSGIYLGRVSLPAPVNFPYPPPTATDTHLYYVTTDALDVEYVVRVKLNKPSP